MMEMNVIKFRYATETHTGCLYLILHQRAHLPGVRRRIESLINFLSLVHSDGFLAQVLSRGCTLV